MSQTVKLLIDECLGSPLAMEIANFVQFDGADHQVKSLMDYFAAGTPDSEWIPQVRDGGWIILTSDRGRSGKVKLPKICVEYGITHILIGPSIAHLRQFEKGRVIVAAWSDIKSCAAAPSGSRFLLTVRDGKPNMKRLEIGRPKVR